MNPKKLPVWLGGLVIATGLFAAPLLTGNSPETVPRVTADSLQSILDQALEAFAQSEFAAAAEHFQRLENDFGQEPEYEDELFLRRLLPIQGQAELAAGLPAAAAKTLARFVEAFPADPQHPNALYSLGIALHQSQRTPEAAARFEQFEKRYPERPEAGLALLQRSQLLATLGEADEAARLLQSFSRGDAPAILRDQARLRLSRQFLDTGEAGRAADILLAHRWDVSTMPEVAALSFLALDLGDQLLQAGKASAALRAYRLVLPRVPLVVLQEERIAEIQEQLEHPAQPSKRFWQHYYRNLLERLERQAASLRDGDDYTPALLLRRGQAMLLADRPHEAWLLFEQLALDKSLPAATREEAHYRWTVAATALELWEEALTIARYFLDRHPDDPLVPQTLSLIAQAHQEQRRYAEASGILATLLDKFPKHPLAQRWQFTLGFNRTLMEDYPAARRDFRKAAEKYSDGALTPKTELWHALTFFFERSYDQALAEFDALARRYDNHPLTGEILYRRAATLYAMREYDRAAEATANFVDRFRRHQRHGEALVLLGDILMGAGHLDEALASFREIPPEAGHLFLYGLFQRGKILRARQAYEEMIALFSPYVQEDTGPKKPRLSEALYWIGWAHAQLNRSEKTVPLLLEALRKYGDDPASREIHSILGLLAKLYPYPDATAPDFSSWIDQERQQALAEKRSAYFARLTLYLAQINQKQDRPHHAENLLFEIVNRAPVETLGPDALGKTGHFLLQKNLSSARTYFDRLLDIFPEAAERALAYHGLGELSYSSEDYEEALVWFRRFENETPSHQLAPEVFQRIGESLLALGKHNEAVVKFEEILQLRSLRGRSHAAALMGLGDAMVAANEPERAVAYYQRVYTMHRAQNDLIARAYFASSKLFEQLDDLPAAQRTLSEMLTLTELAESDYYAKAREAEKRLAAKTDPSPAP